MFTLGLDDAIKYWFYLSFMSQNRIDSKHSKQMMAKVINAFKYLINSLILFRVGLSMVFPDTFLLVNLLQMFFYWPLTFIYSVYFPCL